MADRSNNGRIIDRATATPIKEDCDLTRLRPAMDEKVYHPWPTTDDESNDTPPEDTKTGINTKYDGFSPHIFRL